MFTDDQKAALAAKLDRSTVKERSQAGRTFSYIEGWHAIAECNRIFGFDGWSRETLEMRCVWEGARNDKQAAYYTAKVRVTVIAGGQTIVREGTGSGSGFDRDLGAAHESAIKEAETDAMKRALMTFGNPFGLALYDKSQAEVETAAPAQRLEPPRRNAPRPANVERDRHFGNAADEIRSGQNGIPGGQKPAAVTVKSDPKAWVASEAGKDFIRDARHDLGTVETMEGLRKWEADFRDQLDAFDEHGGNHTMKDGRTYKQFVDGLVADTYDRVRANVTNLRAAG